MRALFGMIILGIFLFGMNASAYDSTVKGFIGTAFTAQGELDAKMYPELSRINIQLHRLPIPVQALFGNQRIRVDLTLDDGTQETFGIVTINNSIRVITRYSPENPTMRVETDEETVKKIAYADEPATAVVEAVNQGRLHYEGIRPQGTVTTFAADATVFMSNLVNTFARLFGY